MKRLNYIYFLILLPLFLCGINWACKKSNNNTSQNYSFTCPDTVIQGQYFDLYVNATSAINLFWNFGDGNTKYISYWNATTNSYAYTSSGIFTISLIVNNDSTHKFSKQIVVLPSFLFNYSGNQITGDQICFNFIYQSTTGNTFLWYFGDGSKSVAPGPCHSYSVNGTFTISVEINNDSSTIQTKTIQIYPAPVYKHLFDNIRNWSGYKIIYSRYGAADSTRYAVTNDSFPVTFVDASNISFLENELSYNASLSTGNSSFFGNPVSGPWLYYNYITDSASLNYSFNFGGLGTPPSTESDYLHSP